MTSAECRKSSVGESPLNEEERRALQMAAWHKKGALVVEVDQIMNPMDRQMFENFGNREFGKRNNQL